MTDEHSFLSDEPEAPGASSAPTNASVPPPAPPAMPVWTPAEEPPRPSGAAPFRWKGYPGLPLTGGRRSLRRTLGLPVAGTLLLFVLSVAAGFAAPSLQPDARALLQLAVVTVSYGVWVALALVGRKRRGLSAGEALGFRPFRPASGLLAAFAVVGIAFVAEMAYGIALTIITALTEFEIPPPPSMTDIFPVTPIGIGAAVIAACIIAPLGEEVLFRGVLFSGLRDRIGDWWAAIISAVIFAVVHLSWYSLFPILVIGLLLAWLTTQTRSLWPAVIAHGLFNGSTLVLTYVLHFLTQFSPAALAAFRAAVAGLLG